MQITLTDLAREQILAAIQEETQEDLGLRVAIVGQGPGGFRYALDLVTASEHPEDDVSLDLDGLQVHVDRGSAEKLDGITIDFVTRLQESGFKFDNPNSVWSDEKAAAVQQVIDSQINPAIASHGGFITLLDVKQDVAYIAFGGGCQGCGMADVTLKEGVQVMLKEAVPEIKQVLDTTDHAAGTNPYYQGPPPDGSSPAVDPQGP
jgi:Fe/S biogenesis protein NfuA